MYLLPPKKIRRPSPLGACGLRMYQSILGKCLPNHHHLTILDADTFLCILHTTTGEVVEGSFHFSVFTFQFVNACFLFSKSNYLAETTPRRSYLITVNGSIRNMQGDIFWIRTIKCIALCRRHILSIAIDINEFRATCESPIPYARHTIADSNRSQTGAFIESSLPYALHTIADSNRSQT